MSKSPNIFLPAIGITGIVLGAAYGLSTRNSKAEEAEAALAKAQVAETRAAELAMKVEEVQAAAEEKAATMMVSLTAPAPTVDGQGDKVAALHLWR